MSNSVRLGDIFTVSSGGTPSKKETSFYESGTIPWVKTGDLKEKYIPEGIECITEAGLNNSSAKLFPKDTVLIAMYGATIGACSILPYEAATNQACAAFLPHNDVLPEYLFYFLSSKKEQFIKDGVGGAQPNISAGYLKNVKFDLKPIAKQKEVISSLNLLDSLISLRKQQLAKLDQLVKSRFVELFGKRQYPKVALIDLIKEGSGLSYGIVQPGDDGTGDMGVLRPVDMVDGKISTASIKYIDRSIGDGFKKTELTGDELLITVRGTTGITALTDSRFAGMNVTRGIAVIRYDRNMINPVYLNAYLNTDESQRYIQEHTQGATLQQINLSDLRVQEIIVPPQDRQEQMATFVEQTDKSKLAIQQSLDKLETLKKSLMQEYFG
ncbi:restriction endonuclease subunit S [bacterium]|nr:restriction endonuclease subunit S [bacterium]